MSSLINIIKTKLNNFIIRPRVRVTGFRSKKIITISNRTDAVYRFKLRDVLSVTKKEDGGSLLVAVKVKGGKTTSIKQENVEDVNSVIKKFRKATDPFLNKVIRFCFWVFLIILVNNALNGDLWADPIGEVKQKEIKANPEVSDNSFPKNVEVDELTALRKQTVGDYGLPDAPFSE